LPREYVAEHVDLAYARTGAGAQGRTVDVGILFLDRATDVRNLYVPMTRGRSTNEVFVATTGEQTALDVLAQSIATDWIDRPALARQAELKKASDIAADIERQKSQRDNFDTTRQTLDQWAGRPFMEKSVPPAAPPYRANNKWSELTDTELTLAEWAGRGPSDYLPEDGADPNCPTKPWDEMEDAERYLAETYGYEPIGDRWRRVSDAPHQLPGRELPGIEFPGF